MFNRFLVVFYDVFFRWIDTILYSSERITFTKYILRVYHSRNDKWIFVMTGINFFSSIPESILESARMDGASELRVLSKIVLPVSKPFLATLALFSAVGQWNSWLDSAYYVRDNNLRTLSYKMMTTINQTLATTANTDAAGQMSQANTATTFTVQATAMVVSMLPIMCVYPFLQKYFVQGMMIGAVKGIKPK